MENVSKNGVIVVSYCWAVNITELENERSVVSFTGYRWVRNGGNRSINSSLSWQHKIDENKKMLPK